MSQVILRDPSGSECPPIPESIVTFLQRINPLEEFKDCKDEIELARLKGRHDIIDLLAMNYRSQNNQE